MRETQMSRSMATTKGYDILLTHPFFSGKSMHIFDPPLVDSDGTKWASVDISYSMSNHARGRRPVMVIYRNKSGHLRWCCKAKDVQTQWQEAVS